MHPVEARHGDLGIMQKNDLLIALSYSGETEELLVVLTPAKRLGVELVSITASRTSSLGRMSDLVVEMPGAERGLSVQSRADHDDDRAAGARRCPGHGAARRARFYEERLRPASSGRGDRPDGDAAGGRYHARGATVRRSSAPRRRSATRSSA